VAVDFVLDASFWKHW